MKRRRDLKQQSIGVFFSGPAAKKSRDDGACPESEVSFLCFGAIMKTAMFADGSPLH